MLSHTPSKRGRIGTMGAGEGRVSSDIRERQVSPPGRGGASSKCTGPARDGLDSLIQCRRGRARRVRARHEHDIHTWPRAARARYCCAQDTLAAVSHDGSPELPACNKGDAALWAAPRRSCRYQRHHEGVGDSHSFPEDAVDLAIRPDRALHVTLRCLFGR